VKLAHVGSVPMNDLTLLQSLQLPVVPFVPFVTPVTVVNRLDC
jgi:hypothetical protein